MALAPRAAVLGEVSEVRDIRFEQTLAAGRGDSGWRRRRRSRRRGVVDFVVETYEDGERVGRASAVLHAREDEEPPAYDMRRCSRRIPTASTGAELRKAVRLRRDPVRPAFTGLAAVHTAEGPASTVLAEVALPGPIRSDRRPTGFTQRCWTRASSRLSRIPTSSARPAAVCCCRWACAGCAAYARARNAHYCHTRVTRSRRGRRRSRSRGARRARDGPAERAGAAARHRRIGGGHADRVLNERLLTIEWQQRELPEVTHVEAGSWLLISTSDNGDLAGDAAWPMP